jgi:hypothetical protein
MKSLGRKPDGAHLEAWGVMPHLGEPVEPAHAEGIEPWWRVVDTAARKSEPVMPAATALPKGMSWPID